MVKYLIFTAGIALYILGIATAPEDAVTLWQKVTNMGVANVAALILFGLAGYAFLVDYRFVSSRWNPFKFFDPARVPMLQFVADGKTLGLFQTGEGAAEFLGALRQALGRVDKLFHPQADRDDVYEA